MVSQPTQPDPMQTAQAQGVMNQQTAIAQTELNNQNQVTPYGSINYNQTGTASDGTPQFTATTQLSPAMQSLADSNISNAQGNSNLEGSLLNNASSAMSKPLDLGWSATEANLDALGRKTLDPQMAQQNAALEQKLASQGVTQGSEAWNNAMQNQNNASAAAYNNLYLTGHQQAVNDLTSQYNSPLNALTALRANSQVSQPGVGQTAATAQTGIQAPNYAGLVQQNYQNQLQASNASMGGLFGLGGSLLGAGAKLATGGLF
jgi:hypothetical protein